MATLPDDGAQTTASSIIGSAENEQAGYAVQSFDEKPQEQSRSAVFVSHGMGQQIRFETLAQIAEGLRAEDERSAGAQPQSDKRDKRPRVITIKSGEKELQGIRLNLAGAHVVDIFEGYWAPLTEGQITLRNVISFLFNGGLNGCKNTFRPFTRFLFNNYCEYPPSFKVLIALVVTLLAVAALVSMNSAIALVAAGRALFSQAKSISDDLIIALTTVFDLFLAVALFYLLVLALFYLLRHPGLNRRLRALIGKTSQLLFLLLMLPATIVAGFMIACLSYKHFGPGKQEDKLLALVNKLLAPITTLGTDFNWWCGVVLLSILAILVLPGLGYLIYRFSRRDSAARSRQQPEKKRGVVWALVCAALLAGAIYLLYLVATQALAPILTLYKNSSPNWVNLSPWVLLVAVSEMVRRFLVQYPGDVAIYVMPYSLDRFYLLREKIREKVTSEVKVVFEASRSNPANSAGTEASDFEYQQVFVVGHSLGSVVVYDALNKLLSDDVDHGKSLKVAERVKLLLTFGSPLDKIAFLFARPDNKLCEARDALQSAAQPLIADTKFRKFLWINIFSPLDIISGELNFFDPPEQKAKRRGPAIPDYKPVINLTDPQSTIYLAAHVEYWSNDLLFQILHSAITDDRPRLEPLIKENQVKKTA